MRSFTRLTLRLSAILSTFCLLGPAEAQPPSAGSADGSSVRFHLHQSYKPCGKKWAKRAARLSQEQLAWMLDREHRLYQFNAAGRTVMTIELLSTASFRACDVKDHWSRRETSIRVTYFQLDGARETKLVHFSNDEIFFDQLPKIYAAQGRVLLRGVKVDGAQGNRWLSVERLPELLEQSRRAAAPAARSAAVEQVASAADPIVVRAYAAASGL